MTSDWGGGGGPSMYDPASTRRSQNVGSMLGQRRRRWANIEPTLGTSRICWVNIEPTLSRRLVFAKKASNHCWLIVHTPSITPA